MCLAALMGCATAPEDKAMGGGVVISTMNKAEDNYRAGRLDVAYQQYIEVLKHDPSVTEAKLKIANIDLRKGNFEAAERQYKELIDENPRMERAHHNLALVQLIQAEQHLRYFIALAPPEADVSHIVTLLTAIDRFSKGNAAASRTPLHSLADTVSPGGTGRTPRESR